MPKFTSQEIGTGTARFLSGVAIPSSTDAAVDPYFKTRIPKETQVECIQFWPQIKEKYPGIVLLHEWWGPNEQIKDIGMRLAGEGYGVIIPNLYGRQGGMVTANAEVAAALMERTNETAVLQDINTCCEFLNTQDYVKHNIHGVVGFGMGGSLAIRFACSRKRLRAAVSFYGKIASNDVLKDLYCPLQYHHAGQGQWATPDDLDRLRATAQASGKKLDVKAYPDAPHAFCNDTRKDTYRADATKESWDATIEFLHRCFQGT